MKYTDVKEWMDALIENMEERKNLTCFNNQIRTTSESGDIQIYTGIDILADLLGIELKEESLEDIEYPYLYYFFYRGKKICQIKKERMIAGAGTN